MIHCDHAPILHCYGDMAPER